MKHRDLRGASASKENDRLVGFKIWDVKNKKYVTANCGRFLLDENLKLYFKEELPSSDGRLEELSERYKIVWLKEGESND